MSTDDEPAHSTAAAAAAMWWRRLLFTDEAATEQADVFETALYALVVKHVQEDEPHGVPTIIGMPMDYYIAPTVRSALDAAGVTDYPPAVYGPYVMIFPGGTVLANMSGDQPAQQIYPPN